MNFHLSPEMENEVIRRVQSKQAEQQKELGRSLSQTEKKELVETVCKEIIFENMISNWRHTISHAAAISPEAQDIAMRELQRGTPLEAVQKKLLNMAGVTPSAGKEKGQGQSVICRSFSDISDDDFFRSLCEPAEHSLTNEGSTPRAASGKEGGRIRMSEISDDDFMRSLSQPATFSLGG